MKEGDFGGWKLWWREVTEKRGRGVGRSCRRGVVAPKAGGREEEDREEESCRWGKTLEAGGC